MAEFYDAGMAKQSRRKNYIREWRTKRNLSLRKLADRLETEPGGKLVISHASISRIEQGKQPWSEDILVALSEALQVPIGMLIDMNPEKEGEVVDLVRRLDEQKRAQVLDYIRFIASK